MTCHDFKIQIEEQYDDLALLHLDGYWRDSEAKANFLARKFATAESENHLRDQGNLRAPAISTFPLLMIWHLRCVYIARLAQLRSTVHSRAADSVRSAA